MSCLASNHSFLPPPPVHFPPPAPVSRTRWSEVTQSWEARVTTHAHEHPTVFRRQSMPSVYVPDVHTAPLDPAGTYGQRPAKLDLSGVGSTTHLAGTIATAVRPSSRQKTTQKTTRKGSNASLGTTSRSGTANARTAGPRTEPIESFVASPATIVFDEFEVGVPVKITLQLINKGPIASRVVVNQPKSKSLHIKRCGCSMTPLLGLRSRASVSRGDLFIVSPASCWCGW